MLHGGRLATAIVTSALFLAGCGGGSDDKKADAAADATQTVSFQKPDDPGPDPFTEPADVEGNEEVEVDTSSSESEGGSQQPFGGSGSNRVCDRDKLIKFLKDNPVAMREWARVLGITPKYDSVKKYIAKLHPATLRIDTQVTNHSFKNGQAVPFQAILQAGTAVLVDEHGKPVARCYCGNPLTPAVYVATAKCTGCPPNYKPPKQCKYGDFEDYDESFYPKESYSNDRYDQIFVKRITSSRYRRCYTPYPDPPEVTIIDVYPPPEPEPEPARAPAPQAPQPQQQNQGIQCDPPRSQLESEQCAERQGRSPEPTPPPATTPTPSPGICNDGLDNEGVSGLIDGEDPNCQ